jgi:outer membrane protein assembly factor BamB
MAKSHQKLIFFILIGMIFVFMVDLGGNPSKNSSKTQSRTNPITAADIDRSLMTKTWGGADVEQAQDVALDASGNIYVVGDSSADINTNDGYILKYLPDGTLSWSHRWATTTAKDYFKSVVIDYAGNIYVGGYTLFDNSYLFVTKYNSAGVNQWNATWRWGTSFLASERCMDIALFDDVIYI